MVKISVIVNTRNEGKNLARCLGGVYESVDEIVIVDMESTDDTKKIAKQFNAKIYDHKHLGYVEPARNFALSKATGEWILLLDADEIISAQLFAKLKNLAESGPYDFIRIPRKKIIFDKWIKHTGWWPDYQIRFFKRGVVEWGDEIHSIPITQGSGFDLEAEEKNALLHHTYQSIDQFIDRLNRYTTAEAQELIAEGEEFVWKNILQKPSQEFLSRFFLREGYKDGFHGLVLSLLQAFSMFVVQLKVWESKKFLDVSNHHFLADFSEEQKKIASDYHYWVFQKKAEKEDSWKRNIYKARSRFGV